MELFMSCILRLIMPFTTQAIVDLGIKNSDIQIIWIILLILCHIRISHYTDNVSTAKILPRCVFYLATVFISMSFAV